MDSYYNRILSEHLSIFNNLSVLENKVNDISNIIYNSFKKTGKFRNPTSNPASEQVWTYRKHSSQKVKM